MPNGYVAETKTNQHRLASGDEDDELLSVLICKIPLQDFGLWLRAIVEYDYPGFPFKVSEPRIMWLRRKLLKK